MDSSSSSLGKTGIVWYEAKELIDQHDRTRYDNLFDIAVGPAPTQIAWITGTGCTSHRDPFAQLVQKRRFKPVHQLRTSANIEIFGTNNDTCGSRHYRLRNQLVESLLKLETRLAGLVQRLDSICQRADISACLDDNEANQRDDFHESSCYNTELVYKLLWLASPVLIYLVDRRLFR